MKCPKCHYTSFDHLSVCDKCGADLSDIRRKLNLLDFSPNLPDFFAMSEAHAAIGDPATETTSPTKDETPSDIGHEDDVIRIEDVTSLEGPGIALQAGEGGELDGITMGDLNGASEMPIMLDLEDEAVNQAGPSGSGEPFGPVGHDDGEALAFEIDGDELELELSEEEMERIIMELDDTAQEKKKVEQEAVEPDGEITLVIDDEGESS